MLDISILAIGNEVLCGKIVNTNSAYIAEACEKIGAKVVYQQVVADSVNEIVKGLKQAYSYADLVLTIGGLGPTVDDLTRQGVATFFGERLVYDEELFQTLKNYFGRMNYPMPSSNERQAYRFENGSAIPNPNGTAPGLFLEKNNQSIFLLPGPPNELKAMFSKNILSYLNEKIDEPRISRSYRLHGIGESHAEEKIMKLYEKYPYLTIAPYCSISYVDYVVSTIQRYEKSLNDFEEEFLIQLGEYCIGDQTCKLNEEIVRILTENKLTLATAESCTGGLLASEIVNVEGASKIFLEGVVTYSNESKIKRLTINPDMLVEYGAVSEQVAKAMSQNLKSITGTDVTISITGIAGPSGGTELKPVGLVYIGLTLGDKTSVHSYIFSGNREKIRERTATRAMFLLYTELKAIYK